jgi:hypothetical protein
MLMDLLVIQLKVAPVYIWSILHKYCVIFSLARYFLNAFFCSLCDGSSGVFLFFETGVVFVVAS